MNVRFYLSYDIKNKCKNNSYLEINSESKAISQTKESYSEKNYVP